MNVFTFIQCVLYISHHIFVCLFCHLCFKIQLCEIFISLTFERTFIDFCYFSPPPPPRIIVKSFGNSFKTLEVKDLKLPDQAWESNDLFGYVERLVNKIPFRIMEVSSQNLATTVSSNNTRSSRSVPEKSKPDAKADNSPLELPLNKTGTVFSGTVS